MSAAQRRSMVPTDSPSCEHHFTPDELAERWKVDVSTIRKTFMDEPGVLKFGHDSVNGRKRPYVTLRIPQSVADRVHSARSRGWAEGEAARKQATRARRLQVAPKPPQSSA